MPEGRCLDMAEPQSRGGERAEHANLWNLCEGIHSNVRVEVVLEDRSEKSSFKCAWKCGEKVWMDAPRVDARLHSGPSISLYKAP